MRSKLLHILIGLLLTGLGLYLFFRKAGEGDDAVLGTLMREIGSTNIAAVIACAVLTVIPMWLRAVRLGVMLPGDKPLSGNNLGDLSIDKDGLPNAAARPKRHKRGLFAVVTVSYMINNILPARIGEAARVFLLWRRNGFPITVSIGALLLERALDIVAYLSFLFLPVLLSPSIAASLRGVTPAAMAVAWLAAAGFVFLAGLFTLYALLPRIFRSVFGRMTVFMPVRARAWAGKVGAELESSLDWVFSPRKASAVAALTLATGLCYAAMLPILIGDWTAFGYMEAVFCQSFAAFGASIPLAPGSVGTLHAVLLQGLTVTGIEAGKARAVVVLYHGIQYVVVTGLGLVLLFGLNIRIRDFVKKS
ncbi:MAG: flippase-like domain-containing protein [Chitinispirillia bacterium]|nr:flippase-like domain-containing protein [Chitinispirillia bacterium]MCL2241585.1 flippase-like domain-containing protein [Chitinispirillia bacterium]